MRTVSQIIGIILICVAIGTTLHQALVYGGWEWQQMFSLNHHEGIAAVTGIIGLLLLATGLSGKEAK